MREEEENMLEKLFHLKENKTTVKTEVTAGITSFFTMAYIIFVNPQILSAAGMDPGRSYAGNLCCFGNRYLPDGIFGKLPVCSGSGHGS